MMDRTAVLKELARQFNLSEAEVLLYLGPTPQEAHFNELTTVGEVVDLFQRIGSGHASISFRSLALRRMAAILQQPTPFIPSAPTNPLEWERAQPV